MRSPLSNLFHCLGVLLALTCQLPSQTAQTPATAHQRKVDAFDILALPGGGKAKDVTAWEARRQEILRGVESIMGRLPGESKKVPLDMKVEEEVDCGSYVRRRITYVSEPGCRTPAYLCVPRVATPRQPAPAVLCLHPTDNVVGYKVVVGLGGKANRQYASELAEHGFITISPAYPLLADYQPDLKALGWESGTLKAVWDNMRALDVLDAMPEVQHGRYGAIGHSLGGHNAVYTAVHDGRIHAVVSSCGLDSYRDYYGGDPTKWVLEKGWCQTRYMPRLAAYQGRLAEIPFDFPELLAVLAPIRMLINAPVKDSNFQWQSVDRVAAAAHQVYELHGSGMAELLEVVHPDCGHDFPDGARKRAYQMLEEALTE